MVFIELRYLDSYDSDGTRTNVQDVGAGFLSADGSRVLSSSSALDVKALLAQSSLSAVMELVTSLPTPSNAFWGQWYGQSDSAGRVTDVYYRREESRTEQLWLPARLNAQNRNLHGFSTLNSTLTYGYQRGGALSPEAGIVELVEELDAGGNYTTRVLVPNDGPLNSLISAILFWKSDGQSGYTTSREIPLFHDTSFLSSETNRYVSAVYTDAFKFDPGRAYEIKWRVAGAVHDLVIQPSEALRRVVDEEELAESVAKINRELYETEDRVAALESAPAPTPGGGGGGAEALGTGDLVISTPGLFHATGVTLPTDKTWAYVSIGTHSEATGTAQDLGGVLHTEYAPGPWQRFLISDFLGLVDVTTTTAPSSSNSIHSEVELQIFREIAIGTTSSGEMLVSIPHKNAVSTITGPLRVMVS